MIGTKLYQKKSRTFFFVALYGLLALIGVALICISLYRNENPSGVEGFTLIFAGGMAFLSWKKGRSPRVAVGETHLELSQQNRHFSVAYRDIADAVRRDKRLVLAVRDGHRTRSVTVWLNDLEDSDADKLAEFCRKKGRKA